MNYAGAEPLPIGRQVSPFNRLAPNVRRRIVQAVALPKPPGQWLDLGFAQMPSRAWYEWHWHRSIDPERIRTRITDGLRRQVIERDGLTCGLCGDLVDPSDVHIDHVLPVALGGTNDPHNLQVAHSRCNIQKGAKV